MIKKFPIISPQLGVKDIWQGALLDWSVAKDNLVLSWSLETNKKYVYLADSGIACFYLALLGLKAGSERREVILPAYTAGSLVVAVKKAGLKPVLCDISLNDFNLDQNILSGLISQNTLAIVGVHMFGIPMNDSVSLKAGIPQEVCFIEDCCQAQGSKIDGSAVGTFGQISFFSFNRGKNFSLLGGGCICMDNQEIATEVSKLLLRTRSSLPAWGFTLGIKMWFSSLATNPFVYGWVNPLIARFKENAPPEDFSFEQLSGFQIGVGKVLLQKREKLFIQRHANGEYLANRLRDVPGLRLAKIKSDSYPVYNRFPVVFDELSRVEKKQKQLWRAGFESSRMYLSPLHKMFRLGYLPQDFPNANYFAERVLTLPVYPALKIKDLNRMIGILRS